MREPRAPQDTPQNPNSEPTPQADSDPFKDGATPLSGADALAGGETPFGGGALGLKCKTFCQMMALGSSAASAAREAGYAPANARSQGHRLMQDTHVLARIAELQHGVAAEAARRRGEVIRQLDEAMQQAARAEQCGAVLRALALKAELYGLRGAGSAEGRVPPVAWPAEADEGRRTTAERLAGQAESVAAAQETAERNGAAAESRPATSAGDAPADEAPAQDAAGADAVALADALAAAATAPLRKADASRRKPTLGAAPAPAETALGAGRTRLDPGQGFPPPSGATLAATDPAKRSGGAP